MKNRDENIEEVAAEIYCQTRDDEWVNASAVERAHALQIVQCLLASGLVVLADDLEEIGCFCPICDCFEYHDERAGHELIHGRGESWRPVYVKRVWGVSDAGWTPRGKRTTSGHLPGSG